MPLHRITITIAESLVREVDRLARQLDRSRSWVVSEAVRRYVREAGRRAHAGSAVREADGRPYGALSPLPADAAAEVAAARRRHLATEVALPPGERLRRAEELGRLARESQQRGHRAQIIGFETYEDYYAWKRARRIGA